VIPSVIGSERLDETIRAEAARSGKSEAEMRAASASPRSARRMGEGREGRRRGGVSGLGTGELRDGVRWNVDGGAAAVIRLGACSLETACQNARPPGLRCAPSGLQSFVSSRPQAFALQVLIEIGHIFAVAVEQQRRARSLVPITCSVAWLQRGWETCGLTFAQKPYSDACRASQKVFGPLVRKRHPCDRL